MSLRNVIKFVAKHRTPLRQAELDLLEARKRVSSLWGAHNFLRGEMALDAIDQEFDWAMDKLFEAERRVKKLRAEGKAAA